MKSKIFVFVCIIVVLAAADVKRAAGVDEPDYIGDAGALYQESESVMYLFSSLGYDLDELRERMAGAGLDAHARALDAYRPLLALATGNSDAVMALQEKFGVETFPRDVAPRFSNDVFHNLSSDQFQPAADAVYALMDKNRNAPYLGIYLNELRFELFMDNAFVSFQTAYGNFEKLAPVVEEKIAAAGAGGEQPLESVLAAALITLTASQLGQNTKVIAYHKKYESLLKRIPELGGGTAIEKLYRALSHAYIVHGDYETARRLMEEMNNALAGMASGGGSGAGDKSMDAAAPVIGAQGEEYYYAAEELIGDGDFMDETKQTEYLRIELEISNIESVQAENLQAMLWICEGVANQELVSFDKNEALIAIDAAGGGAASRVAGCLNANTYEGFTLTAEVVDDTHIKARALGIPRRQFNVMLPVFEYFAMPSDSMEWDKIAPLLDSLLKADAGAFRALHYRAFALLASRAAGNYDAFAQLPEVPPADGSAYPLTAALLHGLWALGAADTGRTGPAFDAFHRAQALVADKSQFQDVARPTQADAIAMSLAAGRTEDPKKDADTLKTLIASSQDNFEKLNLTIILANALYRAALYEESLAAFQDAAGIAAGFSDIDRTLALIDLGRGNCAIMLRRHEDARAAFDSAAARAGSAGNRLLQAAALGHTARVALFTGDYAAAEKTAVRALALAEDFADRELAWQALFTRARSLEGQGKLADANVAYDAALGIIENTAVSGAGGTASLDADTSDVFRYAAVLAARMNNNERALQIIERQNAFALRGQFDGGAVAFHDPSTRGAADSLNALKSQITGYESQLGHAASLPKTDATARDTDNLKKKLQDAQREYIGYINQLEAGGNGLAALYKIEPLDLVKVRKNLPADMAVIYYLLGEDNLYIFYVRTDAIGFKEVPVNGAAFANLVNLFRHNISDRGGAVRMGDIDPAAFTPTNDSAARRVERLRNVSNKLYDALIAPILPELAGVRRIGVIPNGILHFVPFQALMPTDGHARFLLDEYAVFYLDTLTVMQKDAPAPQPATLQMIAFADADKTLPATEEEARAIRGVFPDARVFVGAEATENRAKDLSESGGIFHFATHGVLDFSDITRSYIVLAPNAETGDDGRFTIEEVWGYWWGDASLVSLSACSTAQGELTARGKAVNPASAFLNAGAPTVLATLWNVDDNATARLMSLFYSNMTTMEKIDALRAAQLELAKDPNTVHPYFWAPFALIGDWR